MATQEFHEQDNLETIMATQAFIEERGAVACLYHHATKSKHDVRRLPFTLGYHWGITETQYLNFVEGYMPA